MNGYERIARAAAFSDCRCWFSVENDSLSAALDSFLKNEGIQPETSDQAACMALGAAAAGECPLLVTRHIGSQWLFAMEEKRLSCVIVQVLPEEKMKTLEETSARLLLPTDGAEAAQLTKEAFTIARTQKAPVVLRVSCAICEAVDEPASKTAAELYRQMEQVMNSVGARLDEAGRKLDEKLNAPEVMEKAEALKKQAETVTIKAADGLARGAAALADGLGRLVRSFENQNHQDDDSDDGNANG